MAVTEFIAAIDISSTKMYGIVGRKEPDGSLQILAFNETSSSSFMKKGIIYNIDKASMAMKSVIKQLKLQLNSDIRQIYVGINAQSMITKENSIRLDFDNPTVIEQAHIDEITDQNGNKVLQDKSYTLIDVYPQEYKIGLDSRDIPKGIQTSKPLIGNFVNVISSNRVENSIDLCFEKLNNDEGINIALADLTSSHIASAELLLSGEEKEAGCAFVNFGAETTAVSIYQNNKLRSFTVIPLGGRNLTKDLTLLKIIESRAEDIKYKYGNVFVDDSKDIKDETIYKEVNSNEELKAKDINNLIAARQQEIIQNVWYQIQKSKYANNLNAGIIYTGGAGKIVGMKPLIQRITKFTKVKEATLQPLRVNYSSVINSLIDPIEDSRLYMIYSLLLLGNINCAPKVIGQSGSLFGGETLIEDQEKDKAALEEEAKKIKEEEEEAARAKELQEQREREEKARLAKEKDKEEKKKKQGFWNTIKGKISSKVENTIDSWSED